ncbi:amidohydrolase family protein [Lactiplantibacillus garii]|uniref:Amidohydrolase family protein n=1 Tax=Lactiplantibacillus garii TaxID=2306423 RepID=A0A3R8J7Y7_9LACO|nr:amidohydrolase family protein [Lactiplantibacillus garii]RRK10557.1 amidohydrolase family protein [Lactiplantibacillus garii]
MSKTKYQNFSLFDGHEAKLQPNASFVVDNATGRLVADTGDADHTVDLSGKYVMPGLINAHTHMMMNPQTNKLTYLSEAEVTYTALNNLKELLHAGVTSIRDCGCAFDVDIKLARLRAEGAKFPSPQIIASGRPMSITGGHGDFTEGWSGNTTWGHLTDSPDEMRKAVRHAFKYGAKNIKLMATGGVMSATDQVDDTELSLDEIKTAVAEAHSKHMTVAAHAEGADGIHLAILGGVDSVEHGSFIRDEDIQLMAEKGIYLTPTLIAGYTIPTYGKGKLPQYMIDKGAASLKIYFKRIAAAIRGGVKISFGTDAGTPFNGFKDTPVELQLLTQVGATNYQALFAASRNSAKLLHIDQDYGSLETGKFADFLVLDADPTADVKAVQQTDKGVYQHGVKVN